MKKPTPNYDVMFESAVCSLQLSYAEHKKAVREELGWTFFDNNGNFCILDGYAERRKKTQETKKEVKRLMNLVNELRERREECD